MKITKIKIKNMYGISEKSLDGKSIELTGANGTGKTSVIDAIKTALTNDPQRPVVIKQGETEGEILIETDTNLSINRKKREGKADYKSVKEQGREVNGPESFLKTIFTPLQLNPVEFTQMTPKEQNRIILDLIEYDWDLNWIKDKFGEIPPDVNYEQNILEVLNDIQSENGYYFQARQDVNRDIRNKRAFVSDIAKDIPSGYQADKWAAFDLGEKYKELETIRRENAEIDKAKSIKDSYENRKRGLEADRDIAISAEKERIAGEKSHLDSTIERLKAEIVAAEDQKKGLGAKLQDKIDLFESKYREGLANLEKEFVGAEEYAAKDPIDTSDLYGEINQAEEMKKHLNEYKRMKVMEEEIANLTKESEGLTKKIELARNLPGTILQEATLPVDGLTVKDGIPLIHGLPVGNLSDGQKLELCVDVALSKPTNLQLILIDGAEKLSDTNRQKIYKRCKDKGLQFIATRTDNSEELTINYL